MDLHELRQLIEHSTDGIALLDKDFRFKLANPAYQQLVNRDEHAILGEPLMGVIGRRRFEDVVEPRLKRCLAGEPVCSGPEHAELPSGCFDLEVTYSPFRDAHQQITGIVITVGNIMAQERGLMALERNQARMESLLNAIPDLMFRMNREGIFLDYKAERKDLVEQEAPSLVGLSLRDTAPVAFAEMIERKIERTLASNQLQQFEYELDIPNRGVTYWEARMVPSGPDEVTAISRDITLRRESDDRLRTLSVVVEQSPDAILLTDTHFRITYANRAFEKLFGWSAAELIGESPQVLNAEPDAVQIQELLYRRLERGEQVYDISLNRRKDGSTFHCEYWVSAIRGEDGRVTGFMGSQRDISKNLTLRDELLESEIRYRTIVETSMEGIWVINAEATTTFVNERMAEMLEYPVEAMLNRPLFDFMDHEERERAKELFADREAGKKAIHEFRFQTAGKKDLWAIVSTAPMQDSDGHFTGAFAMVTDITERVEEKVRLVELLGERNILLDHSPALIIYKDTQNRILRANKTLSDMTGLPLSELEGVHSSEVFPDMADKYFQDDLIVINSGEPKTGIFEPLPLPDGGTRWIMTDKYPHFDAQGTVIGIVLFAIDITDLKAAELAIRASEKRYRSLFELIPQGVVLHDRDGMIIDANPAAERILGLNREALLSRDSHDADWRVVDEHGRDFPGDQHPAMKALRAGVAFGPVVMGVHVQRDNRFVWISVSAVPLIEPGTSAPHGVFASFSDITTERELQAALIKSQKLEAIGQLTSGIAHDFNNILGSVLGFTELAQLRLKDRDEKTSRYLLEIENAATRAESLVRNMLTYAGGEAAGQPEEITIADSIAGIIRFLEPTLPDNIEVHFKSLNDQLRVTIDPTHLQQILMNLCLNARDAMQEGGTLNVTVFDFRTEHALCHASRQQFSGIWVAISVKDTGPGFERDSGERIFDPFFTTKEARGRSGMGLSVVAGLLRTYNGHILVESKPGEGSEFTVLLHPATKTADFG